MQCPKCNSIDSLEKVWVWAEYAFIPMIRCYFCCSYFDKQILENRKNFKIIKAQAEEHQKHLHQLKWK